LVQPSSKLADEKNTLLEQIKNKVILVGCFKPHHHHYVCFPNESKCSQIKLKVPGTNLNCFSLST
jgi:hypothetical protein